MSILEIKPLEGIADIKFGVTEKEIISRFGEPEEVEELDPIDDYETTLWHYWDKGLSIFFDKGIELVFTSVEVDNPDATLWDEKIFDMTEEDLKTLFIKKGYSEIDMELMDNGEKRVSFDDAMVDLYFENGNLTGVSYGVFIDKDTTGLN